MTRAGVHRGEEAEVGRPQPARGGDAVAAPEVAAGRADAGRAGLLGRHRHAVAARLGLLLDDDPVGAGRQRRAGEDAHRLARADAARVALAGGGGADDGKHGARAGVLGAAGVAVHRRGVERRLVARGDDVGGEHAAGGLGERDLLDADRCEERHQPGVGFLDRDERHQGASKRPLLPPSLSASRTSPITMPRSTAFSMS